MFPGAQGSMVERSYHRPAVSKTVAETMRIALNDGRSLIGEGESEFCLFLSVLAL